MSLPKLAKAHLSINDYLLEHLEGRRVHPKSLVSTFFGDMVVTQDNFAWVETVFAALELLGVNDRLVRTTLFRLREEGWLDSTRAGRKSYYQLTEFGDNETSLAERRIYYRDTPQWDGSWTLVFLVLRSEETEVQRKLEKELGWMGFGFIAKNVWAYPGSSTDVVSDQIRRLGLRDKVIVMRCENIHDVEMGLLVDDRELASMYLPISEVERDYQQFVEDYSPLINDAGLLCASGSNAEMLSLRLLMLDEYRRITLRDPHLPSELLPQKWAGDAAFILCGKIYKQISSPADAYYQLLQENAGTVSENKSNVEAVSSYQNRFPSI